MSTRERKEVAVERAPAQDTPAAQGAAVPAKKPYRKPVLAKYEQLHGIGLGSP